MKIITYETETRVASPFPSVRIYRAVDGVKEREPVAIFPITDTKDKAQALANLFHVAMDSSHLRVLRRSLGVS